MKKDSHCFLSDDVSALFSLFDDVSASSSCSCVREDGSLDLAQLGDPSFASLQLLAAECLARFQHPSKLSSLPGDLVALVCDDARPGLFAVACISSFAALESRLSLHGGKKLGDVLRSVEVELLINPALCRLLLKTASFGNSLNLRNVLCHGFCLAVPRALALLTVVLCSNAGPTVPRVRVLAFDERFSCPLCASRTSESAVLARLGSVVSQQFREEWHTVLTLLLREQRPLAAMMLLLPLLEQTLRTRWVKANGLEQESACTATSTRLFVTLDILLASALKRPGLVAEARVQSEEEDEENRKDNKSNSNKLLEDLPRVAAVSLLDFFVWSESRLRDLLMHGALPEAQEEEWDDAIRHVLALCLALSEDAEAIEYLQARGARWHPARQLSRAIDWDPLCSRIRFSEREMVRMQVWTRSAEHCRQILELKNVMGEKLRGRAAVRKNKQAAYTMWLQQEDKIHWFVDVLLSCAKKEWQQEAGEETQLMMPLFNTSGALLAAMTRNEANACFQIIADFRKNYFVADLFDGIKF